jgi:hypothetical protein
MRLRYWYSSWEGFEGVEVVEEVVVPLEDGSAVFVDGEDSEWDMTDSSVILFGFELLEVKR